MSQQTSTKKKNGSSTKISKGTTYQGIWDKKYFRKGTITYSDGSKWYWDNGMIKRLES